MYFALHLGDPDNQPPRRQKRSAVENGSCSLEMYVNRTRESIILMENGCLRFRLILYENTANATPPMAAREAVEKLENVQPTKNPKKASQTSALRMFKQLTNGRKNDLFVLFVPCKVDVQSDRDDIEELVKEKEGLDGRTMIVSTTIPAQEISKLYAQPLPNVLGKENCEALARKIVDFASTTTTHSTSSTPTTSPMNTTSSPPTTVRSSSTTTAPTTTTPTTTTTVPTTSTTTTLPTTTTTLPTSTTTVTIPTTTEMPKKDLTCLFAGDMYSLGSNQAAYDQEKRFIDETAKSLFEKANFRGGLSLYGYVRQKFPEAGLNDIRSTFPRFRELLNGMEYSEDSPLMELKNATDSINSTNCTVWERSGVNCLIFISAQYDTSGCSVLNPNLGSDRTIVGIGFNETDLSGIIGDQDRALKIPFKFTQKDVENVVDAVLSR
uniref:Uncharacterized protein n=1 Tax=Haemonchus contortus TaxID=6289 RepID=W6NDU8_HAECO